MLLPSCWLAILLFIVSATAHIFPPAGLKPRYLATGTGISLSSTTTPPYPISSANGTSAPTGSIYPTSTATPTQPPSDFYLVAADTGTDRDGYYAYIGANDPGELVLYLAAKPEPVASFSTFHLNADGTLLNEFSYGIASVYPGYKYGSLEFHPEAFAESQGYIISYCKIVGGALSCQTGSDTVFSICPYQDEEGHLEDGNVFVGQTTEPGCFPLTLLVVPV